MNISAEIAFCLITLINSLYYCDGTVLSKVTKIALDSSRRLEAKRVRALYAAFTNTRALWVQLWNRTYGEHAYRLDWQVRVRPHFGDGSIEVGCHFRPECDPSKAAVELINSSDYWNFEYIDTLHPNERLCKSSKLNLSIPQFVTVVPSIHVLAIMNEQIPGPLNGNYRDGAGVVLSLRDRDHMGLPLNRTMLFHFDNLRLPYHLPVTLCNLSGCPYELGVPPTPRPTFPSIKPVASQPSRLLTEEMLVGLITWNIVLTLLLFLVLLVLVFICADLEKRRKETARVSTTNTSRRPSAIMSTSQKIFSQSGPGKASSSWQSAEDLQATWRNVEALDTTSVSDDTNILY